MVSFEGLVLNSREPVYQQLAAHVRRMIVIGCADDGDPLPSRRDIAQTLDINPNTVQKAFRLMEEQGFIVTNGNAGSVIRLTPDLRAQLGDALTRGLVRAFVQQARQSGLTLPRVMSLLGELWDAP